ncbi:NAD-dependent epimerase/dehydratase family protein [Halobacteriaceae archaeon GCM10025711]
MTDTVLVTGATGAIGSAVLRVLDDSGDDVRAFVRDGTALGSQHPDVEVVTGDILDPGAVAEAVAGVDSVVHCVNFPMGRYERTLDAARTLVEAVGDERPHVVFPGNTWVFDPDAPAPITPETPIAPPSRIARIKAVVEQTLFASNLPVTVVHLPDFYGPDVRNDLVRPLFERPLADRRVVFPALVDVPHEFVYVDDAARALLAVAGEEVAQDRRYTVGSTGSPTVREFVQMVGAAVGTSGRAVGIPPWVVRVAALVSADARAGRDLLHVLTRDVTMDGAAIRRDVGFEPSVSYANGIRRTVDWLRTETDDESRPTTD